jgi:hypothetical protein
MNRSILIVICDFLLLSLLVFSTVDPDALTADTAERRGRLEMNTGSPESKQDLAAVMKLALEDERQAHDQLLGELKSARESLGQQQAATTERERQLAERERQLQAFQQNLAGKDQQARRLADEKAWLEQQVSVAQTNLQMMQKQLASTAGEVALSRELNTVTRDELRREQERAAVLQQLLGQLEKSNQLIQAEKQQMATQLQVTEAEKRAAADQAARMQDEVKTVREEKERLTQHADKLAEGVKTLAAKSGELTQEIRENRALTPNAIFQDLSTNLVHTRFYAYRPAMLGRDYIRRKESEAVLTSDGTNYYALCHVDDTCLALANPSTDWVSLTGALSRGGTPLAIRSVAFALMDPRVVFIPITAAQAKDLGGKVYHIAQDPFKFQEALLVGAREGYYGECKFEIDLATPHYVKMDRSVFRGLFGKFNPSRGDLVVSKTGELLGIMANNTYCLRILNFSTSANLEFGQDVRKERTGELLSRLCVQLDQLPARLR